MATARESRRRAGAAQALASWASDFEPSPDDRALAQRALSDTVAVATAARKHPLTNLFAQLGPAGRLAATAHVLDFDDLHMPSTAHISAVCVSTALATNGGAHAYLAGAGVMARLGTALGWRHYSAGWHATCTTGAPAAAVTAAAAHGLDAEQTATAIALAIPAAGGTQRAFGTAAKSLQVGFAADAGVRAARLAAAGATADPTALDQWMGLVQGGGELQTEGEAVPGGLAIKLFPCCYALQRPIAALKEAPEVPTSVEHVRVTTPRSSLQPLIHSRPTTGLEGKFSLQYAIAAFLTDGKADFDTFSDEAVQRPEVQELMERIEIHATEEGEGLLAGNVTIEVDGTLTATLDLPPGAPTRPPTDAQLNEKLAMCGAPADLTWETAPQYLAEGVDRS